MNTKTAMNVIKPKFFSSPPSMKEKAGKIKLDSVK